MVHGVAKSRTRQKWLGTPSFLTMRCENGSLLLLQPCSPSVPFASGPLHGRVIHQLLACLMRHLGRASQGRPLGQTPAAEGRQLVWSASLCSEGLDTWPQRLVSVWSATRFRFRGHTLGQTCAYPGGETGLQTDSYDGDQRWAEGSGIGSSRWKGDARAESGGAGRSHPVERVPFPVIRLALGLNTCENDEMTGS